MFRLLGIQSSPAVVALLGLAVFALGAVRGGLLPSLVGVGIVGIAALRALSMWRER